MARIRSSQGALNDQNLESKIHQKPFPLLRPIGRSYDLVSFQEFGQLYYLRFFHVLLRVKDYLNLYCYFMGETRGIKKIV